MSADNTLKRLTQGVPAGAVLSRSDAEAICERVMRFSKADGIDVQLGSNHTTNVRFADNQMSTAGAITDGQLAVQSWFGPKHAVVTTNDLSEASLRRCVEQSEVLARLAPDDPEAMPLLEPQQYVPVEAYFESTAATDAAARARAALTALQPARSAGDLKAAGFLVVGAGSSALANSKGMFAYHRATSTNYTLTVRTTDGTGSGWAAADHPDWRQVDFDAVSRRAIDKARASREPRAVEPGRYTVILEPQAVGDLVQLVAGYADARLADEGRSPFSKQGGGNKLGEKIVDERVTLFSDPQDPQLLGQPFDGEGMRLAPGVDRERFAQDAADLALLGAETKPRGDRWRDIAEDDGRFEFDGRHAPKHRTRDLSDPTLVLTRSRSAHHSLYGLDTRRNFSYRTGKNFARNS